MKIIVKYANRKLYDKETSRYTSLTEILTMPLGSFKVIEFGLTARDITTETLLSALGGGTGSDEAKIKVMEHVIGGLRMRQPAWGGQNENI